MHESLDHLRLSQATDDLFEAFRQRYLAFERLLSWRIPSKPGEREGVWLKRALVEADNETDVSRRCSPAWHDFETDFYDDIYQDVRCALFHAKEARRVLSARHLADRALVQSALVRLSQVLRVLYEEWLAIRLSSGIGYGEGFHAGLRSFVTEGGMIISDDGSPLSDDESLADGYFAAGPTAPAQVAEPAWEPDVHLGIGSFGTCSLTCLPHIQRCGLVVNQDLALIERLEVPLTCDDVDRLEVALGFRVRSPSGLKQYFLT